MNLVIDTPTLLGRRIKAEAALLTLEREQGAALLDDKPFDHSTIAAVRAELAAIEQAEREFHRRDDQAHDAQTAAQRRQAADEAQGALVAYIMALERSEAATKALAGELAALGDAAATLRKTFLVMSRRLPIPLEDHSMRTTLSRLIAGELAKVALPNGYGDLKWPSVPQPDWYEHIRKWIEPAVTTAIEETCQ